MKKIVKIEEKLWYPGQPNGQELQECTTFLGTIHILRISTFLGFLEPSPIRKHKAYFYLVLKIRKLAFSDPLPTSSACVKYELFPSERRPSI